MMLAKGTPYLDGLSFPMPLHLPLQVLMEILEGRMVLGVGPPLRWPPAACSSEPTACGVLAVRSEVIDDEMVRAGN